MNPADPITVEIAQLVREAKTTLGPYAIASANKPTRSHANNAIWKLEEALRQLEALAAIPADVEPQQPIPMILHCPSCGLKHIDRASGTWAKLPHRSHLCEGCGSVWRPADVPTVGVEAIKTAGKFDRIWPQQPKAAGDASDKVYRCFICDRPIYDGDMALNDVSGDIGHRDCFGDEREGFVRDIDTGEPLRPDDPLPAGYRWNDPEHRRSEQPKADVEAVASSLAPMIIDYVEGGLRSNQNWRNGLKEVIQLRLQRLSALAPAQQEGGE